MAQHNLAWMPTLSGDTQAVLATDKVRFQGQEVAAVVANDPYIAEDALELIDVDYDPLPAGDHAAAGARADAPADPRRQGGPDRQPRLPLGGRRQGRHRRGVRRRRRVVSLDTLLPALAPGAAGDVRLRRRRRTRHRPGDDLHDLAGAARHPHACSRWWPGCRRRTSGSSAPTSAAASATRCRCTPGTWSRRRRRC